MVKLNRLKKAIKTIDKVSKKGCRIAVFEYTTKKTGEISEFTVLLGVSMFRSYSRDLSILESIKDKIPNLIRDKTIRKVIANKPIHINDYEIARIELVKSLIESVNEGIGNNINNPLRGLYEYYSRGIRFRLDEFKKDEVSDVLFTGMIISKKIIKPGIIKQINSSPKTLAKQEIKKKLLKIGKVRNFCIEIGNLHKIKLDGKVIKI